MIISLVNQKGIPQPEHQDPVSRMERWAFVLETGAYR